MGFSWQDYWSGLPFPPAEDLPDPGTEPMSLMTPAMAGEFFTTRATWEALSVHSWQKRDVTGTPLSWVAKENEFAGPRVSQTVMHTRFFPKWCPCSGWHSLPFFLLGHPQGWKESWASLSGTVVPGSLLWHLEWPPATASPACSLGPGQHHISVSGSLKNEPLVERVTWASWSSQNLILVITKPPGSLAAEII